MPKQGYLFGVHLNSYQDKEFILGKAKLYWGGEFCKQLQGKTLDDLGDKGGRDRNSWLGQRR